MYDYIKNYMKQNAAQFIEYEDLCQIYNWNLYRIIIYSC